MVDEEGIVYIVFTAIIPVIVLANISSFGGGTYLFLIVTIIGLLIAFILIMTYADFVIFPIITGILGINFQPYKDYRITKGQDAVVKNVNGLFYATGFVTANLFAFVFKAEKLGEDEQLKQVQSPESWEKILMSINFAFKFHVLSTGLDIQAVRDDFEGKRSYQEFQLSRALQSANANEVIITDIQRKISVIQTKMDRISGGEKPVATIMYFETTAVGVSESAALDSLAAQIKQLQLAASALDVQLLRVVGREVYSLFRFSFGLPTSYSEVAGNFDTMK